jgi:dihydroneopterin aldolase
MSCFFCLPSPTYQRAISGTSASTIALMDTVILKDLKFDLVVGRDAWRRPGKLQPVSISLNLQPSSNFEAAASQDDVNLTLDYGKLYKTVFSAVKDQIYGNVQGLMLDLARCVESYKILGIDIVMPKAILEAKSGLHYHARIDRTDADKVDASWSVALKGIEASCIIGVNFHERQYKQRLSIDLILGGHQLEAGVDRSELADAGLQDMVKHLVEVYLISMTMLALLTTTSAWKARHIRLSRHWEQQ